LPAADLPGRAFLFYHFFVFQPLAAGGCHQAWLKPEKPIRATAAKEVGMKNPAEKTAVRPNQNPSSPCRASSSDARNGP